MFKNWRWGDTGLAIFTSFVVAIGIGLLTLISFASYQDHSVRFYYLSGHGEGQGRSCCIDGYREWSANDTGVFCSDDIQKVLGVLGRLNAGLNRPKPEVHQ